MNVTEITTVEAQQEENQNEQQDDRFQAMNARFETMETHQISVRKTTLYNKSSFLKIIGDTFRTDYVCSLSSHFTY